MIKVYGVALSPFVRKVHAVLHLKNISFEAIDVLPGMGEPWFYQISPLGKIPALTDGELSLADSTVIAEYLEEQYPEIPLLPKSIKERAKARWIEEYADTKILEVVSGGIFYERIVKPALLKEPTNKERVQDVINKVLPPILDYIEGLLPPSGFIFTDISLADISLVTHFINAEYADYQVSDNDYPRLASLINAVKMHEVIASILDAEKPMLAMVKESMQQ